MADSHKDEKKKIKVFRGERLQSLRLLKGMTQAVLAEEIGVEEYTISRYESGKQEPKYSHLVSLCRVLNVTADYFLGLVDERYVLESFVPDGASSISDELVAEKQDEYRAGVMPDWDGETAFLKEGIETMTAMARLAGRFMVYERSFNYKTKAMLRLWGEISEGERNELLQMGRKMLADEGCWNESE